MNIEITTKEYRDLLDILHIADVVMSGHRKEEDMRTERNRMLIQKLYALARGQGLDHYVSYHEGTNKYVLTDDFEHNTIAHAVIDEFGDHLFWDELIDKLSTRDAEQIMGGTDRLNAMNDSDRLHVTGPIRQRYIEEFTKNGVANLAIIERFRISGEMQIKTSD